MNEDRLRAAYQHVPTTPREGRPGCPPPEALDALASRLGSEAERLETLNHAMGCTACRRELDLLRAVDAALPEPARPRRLWSLAAAAVVLIGALVVWRATHPRAVEPLRGSEDAVTLLGPLDGARVTEPPRLVWHAFKDAAGYRIEVLDTAGVVVASGLGPDTTLQLPAGALTPSDSAYRWRVVAELRTGGTISSTVRRLNLIRP